MDMINQLFGVAGKTVLVTGGAKGIGAAIAEAFVKAGAKVFICSRDLDSGKALAEALKPHGELTPLVCNIADDVDRKRFAAEFRGLVPRLDVLVNNAGALWAAPIEEYPESGWDKVFDLNVRGTFFLIKELLPLLQAGASAEDPSRIINIGSVNALALPKHETYAYTASKAALHHLTRHLASQLVSRHIVANVIAPGQFPSKMLKDTVATKGADALLANIPMGRFANESDMAGAALYLASKAGAYLTGVVLPVDGGYGSLK